MKSFLQYLFNRLNKIIFLYFPAILKKVFYLITLLGSVISSLFSLITLLYDNNVVQAIFFMLLCFVFVHVNIKL